MRVWVGSVFRIVTRAEEKVGEVKWPFLSGGGLIRKGNNHVDSHLVL